MLANFSLHPCLIVKFYQSSIWVPILAAEGPFWVPTYLNCKQVNVFLPQLYRRDLKGVLKTAFGFMGKEKEDEEREIALAVEGTTETLKQTEVLETSMEVNIAVSDAEKDVESSDSELYGLVVFQI